MGNLHYGNNGLFELGQEIKFIHAILRFLIYSTEIRKVSVIREAIVVFTRIPVPGKVKTRLQNCLSSEQCALIQTSFLKDVLTKCKNTGRDVIVFHTEEEDLSPLISCLSGESLVPQRGDGLGERMYNAIKYTLRKFNSCLLIGSDIPGMRSDTMAHAFEVLEKCDLVLGPSTDGGYYLVGMKKPLGEVFSLSCYGDENVLKSTLSCADSAGISYKLLEYCSDVDTESDLLSLAEDITANKIQCPETEKVLFSLGLLKGK